MENKLYVKNYDNIIKILVICLVAVLVPIIIASSIIQGLDNSGVYNLLVGMTFIIQVILLFIYFILFTEKNINKDFVFLLFFLIVSQSLTIYSTILLPINMDYLDLINAIATIISFFIFVCIPSTIKITQKGLANFFLSIVIMALISCLYNLVINFQAMMNFGEITNGYEVNLSSFYLNRNSFAQFIFLAIVANTYLLLIKKQKIYYIIYFLLGLNLFMTLSRGGLAATIIFGLVFMLFNGKRRLVRNLLLTLFSFLIFFLLWFNPMSNTFIVSILIREDAGSAGRSDLWLAGINLLNQTNWFLGVGEFTSIKYFNGLGNTITELHSFYIETLVKGGLLLFLFYIIVFVLMINRYKIIKSADKKTGIIYMSALVSLVFYCLIESISFFTMGYVGSVFTIFFITVPILYSNNFLKRK